MSSVGLSPLWIHISCGLGLLAVVSLDGNNGFLQGLFPFITGPPKTKCQWARSTLSPKWTRVTAILLGGNLRVLRKPVPEEVSLFSPPDLKWVPDHVLRLQVELDLHQSGAGRWLVVLSMLYKSYCNTFSSSKWMKIFFNRTPQIG
jgi:hypothetical protein